MYKKKGHSVALPNWTEVNIWVKWGTVCSVSLVCKNWFVKFLGFLKKHRSVMNAYSQLTCTTCWVFLSHTYPSLPWVLIVKSRYSRTVLLHYQRIMYLKKYFMLLVTLFTRTSVCIFSILFSFISLGTDKENLSNNQELI